MVTLFLLGVLYFLPTLLAAHRGHSVAAILLLNLFFGWTVFGWFALLLWAALSSPPYVLAATPRYYRPPVWR